MRTRASGGNRPTLVRWLMLLVLVGATAGVVACGGGSTPTATTAPTAVPTNTQAAVATAAPTNTPAPTATTSAPPTSQPTTQPAQSTSVAAPTSGAQGSPTATATPAPIVAGLPQPQSPSGTITMVAQDIGQFTGTNGTGGGNLWRMGVTEGPFMLVPPKQVEGMVVQSWDVSPDQKTITLHLRKGIQFQKGYGEMTAADVAWDINDANGDINKTSIHPAAGDIASMLGANPAVAVDPYTVQLTVQHYDVRWAANQFNVAAQTPEIFSKKACVTDNSIDWCKTHIIGTGPFQVDTAVDNNRLVLSTWTQDHWRKNPAYSHFILTQVPEDSTRKAMMLTGEADVAADLSLDDQAALQGKGYAVDWTNGAKGIAIEFGGNYWETTDAENNKPLQPWTTKPYAQDYPWSAYPQDWATKGLLQFKDTDNPQGMTDMEQARLVRVALATDVNRQEIDKELFHGLAPPFYMGGFFPSQPEYQKAWILNYDPTQAAQLLDQAGYPKNSSGVRFNATLITQSGNAGFDNVANAVAGYWSQLGVNVQVNIEQYTSYRPQLVNRTATGIFIAGCRHDNILPWDWPRGLENTSLTRGGFNCYKEIPEFTSMFEKVNQTTDLQQRIALNNQLADWAFHWMVEAGTVVQPYNVVFNPRAISSWAMRDTIEPGWQGPEDIVPASGR